MPRRPTFIALFAIVLLLAVGAISTPKAISQTQRTLVGEWLVRSTPIDNEQFSRMGNSLGFPDRDMFFAENGDIRTGFVAREDVGANVKPLGVWRVEGNRISATFQLWCPDSNFPCGTIVMRGEFVNDDRIKGTMAAFFDVADATRPTGFDTWRFNFTGNRTSSGGGQ